MDISCILNRRSVRKYTAQKITDEQLTLLLKAGMYAPSAKNSQPWEFIAVRDKSTLNQLSEGSQYWKMLQTAPLAIVVVANTENYQSTTTEFFKQDCSAATQNILCAAEGIGLGGVWLGLYGEQSRMAHVCKTLGIPESVQPFSLISIGVPESHPQPHDFFIPEKVHFEKY